MNSVLILEFFHPPQQPDNEGCTLCLTISAKLIQSARYLNRFYKILNTRAKVAATDSYRLQLMVGLMTFGNTRRRFGNTQVSLTDVRNHSRVPGRPLINNCYWGAECICNSSGINKKIRSTNRPDLRILRCHSYCARGERSWRADQIE